MIGYTSTMPQPTDPMTPGVLGISMFLRHGLAILGFLCTLIAMRSCKLGKSQMVEVQKRIEQKKAQMQEKFYTEQLHKEDPGQV